MKKSRTRAEFGDFQTPLPLAEAALRVLRTKNPAAVLEPTCGVGAFLVAAAKAFPGASLRGLEVDPSHVEQARRALRGARARVDVGDFFQVDWEREIRRLPDPLVVVGNPPWVTTAGLSVLRSENLPPKSNWKRLTGLDALTGKSNFDLSEWILVRLLAALAGRRAEVAFLCKSTVARRVLSLVESAGWPLEAGAVHRIDASRLFGASVDAVLLHLVLGRHTSAALSFPVYARLGDRSAAREMAMRDGVLVPDAREFAATARFSGECRPEWRSGMKHDAAKVMELTRNGSGLENGYGEPVRVEAAYVYPWLKSSDVANGRAQSRLVLVPQRSLGEDTAPLRKRAPRLFAYLTRHSDALARRRSGIYRGRPPFSVFGVGPYSFSPWKVAISGLYKRCQFTLVGPVGNRPVLLDDTCYFLPFETERAARRAHAALGSDAARRFFDARIFWDEKRPINKKLLQSLDLERLQESVSRGSRKTFSGR